MLFIVNYTEYIEYIEKIRIGKHSSSLGSCEVFEDFQSFILTHDVFTGNMPSNQVLLRITKDYMITVKRAGIPIHPNPSSFYCAGRCPPSQALLQTSNPSGRIFFHPPMF